MAKQILRGTNDESKMADKLTNESEQVQKEPEPNVAGKVRRRSLDRGATQQEDIELASVQLAKRKKAGPRIAAVLITFVTSVILVLVFTQWQQSVVGNGEVIIFDAMSRPQPVEAQISGRVVSWKVQEGDVVEKGQILGELSDIDSKFLDNEQTRRLNDQIASLELGRSAAMQRAELLGRQQSELEQSRQAGIAAANQRAKQALQRESAARKGLLAAEQNLKIARDVARKAASQRANQAEDRVIQAKQSAAAAEKAMEIARIQFDRAKSLNKDGLLSDRELELADNDFVRSKTAYQSALAQLEIAKKDVNVGNLEQDRASLEIIRAQAAVDQARAALQIAQRDIENAQLDIERVTRDTMATLNSVGASIQSAQETVNKNSADLQKARVDQANVEGRANQRYIVAPIGGQVTAISKVGAGTTVKAGDRLAIVTPQTKDRAVEIFVSDYDVPLLKVGDPVRIQFAGWPAVQFSGWQEYIPSYGTFGGKVRMIDALDDGSSKYRVVIEPAQLTLANGVQDKPWPSQDMLRPGTQAVGWVMLGKVSLGWELWRQFNGFPPNFRSGDRLGAKSGKEGYGDKESKAPKDKYGPKPDTVKLRGK